MLTMGMLERYVLKRTMSALVAALAVLGAMVMLRKWSGEDPER